MIEGESVRPYHPRSAIIQVMDNEGYTKGGVYVSRHRLVPPIVGRILAVHPDCTDIRPNQVVVFRPNSLEEFGEEAQNIYIISEKAIVAIIEGYDETSTNLQKALFQYA